MSKQIMKPVWRVNGGNGVPSDLGDKSMYADFEILGTSNIDKTNDRVWSLDFSDMDIICYQTARTKAAKCIRKDRQVCEGKGKRKLKDWITKQPFVGVCIYCNGKGYKLEAIK